MSVVNINASLHTEGHLKKCIKNSLHKNLLSVASKFVRSKIYACKEFWQYYYNYNIYYYY